MSSAESNPPPASVFDPHDWPWWLAYFILLAMIAGGMIALRSWAFQTYGNEAAISEWQSWKEDATKMSNQPNAPVQRKAPTSAEPPGLRLARDYFVACFAGGMTLAAVLLGVLLLMIRGAIATPNAPIRGDSNAS